MKIRRSSPVNCANTKNLSKRTVCQGHRLSTWLDDSQLQRIIGYNKNWLSLRCGRNFDPDAQWGNENQRIFCNGTSQTGFETSRKNETQAFSFELRHVFATDFFKKWVKLARTRNSKQYTIESKETALNYHQYFLALEGVEHLQRIKNDVGIQVCPICVCEVDKDDDVAFFFAKRTVVRALRHLLMVWCMNCMVIA